MYTPLSIPCSSLLLPLPESMTRSHDQKCRQEVMTRNVYSPKHSMSSGFCPLSPVVSRLSSIVCRLSSVVCLSSIVCCLSSVACQLSSVLCSLSSVVCPLSSVVCRLSPVVCQLSSVVCPLSSVVCPLSSVLCRLSPCSSFFIPPERLTAVMTRNVYPPKHSMLVPDFHPT